MVIVYSDIQKTYADPYDVLVRSIEDYVDAYKSILEAIYQQRSMVVVVQNKHCMNFLMKMQNRYYDYVEIKVNSPRLRLNEMIGILIPEYISDKEIVNDRMIEESKRILFNSGMTFEDNILNHYLGSYFTNVRFPFPKIVDFLKNIDLSPLVPSDNRAILNKIYKRRMKLWEENCNSENESKIVNDFTANHDALLIKLSKYLILKNYPKEIVADSVGESVKVFDKLIMKEAPFIPKGMDTIDIQRNIKICLNQKVKTGLSYDDIVKEIESLSGLFDEELQYMYSLLKQNRNVLDKAIIHKVRLKFKKGSDLDSMFHTRINNIIPPAQVVNPDSIDTVDGWITWALTSYLPYKFWMEENDINNATIDKYSSQYGEWIYNNYDSLISSEGRMLHKTMMNISSFLIVDDVSVIVILDNFNYKYVALCKEYLSGKGFSNTIDKPMISMIPSETSVSKTAFFTGQPFNTEGKSYENMCKDWETYLGGKVKYISDVGKLDQIHNNEVKIYILNYLSIDTILHESQNNSALPIALRIKEELKAMIDKLVGFSKRLGIENKIKVYFISDHGSTKISQEQENLIDSKYYKSKTEECAYRVLALDDNKFNIYKDSIGHLCYVLDRNEYGTKENYLIAKGYNRFLKTDLSFYVHGGITPEENIIPLLKFERIDVKLIFPEVLLRNNEFRYSTISSINLTIKNYNEYSLDNVELSILNSNIQWNQGAYEVAKIEKESQIDISFDKVRLLKSSNDKEKLIIKIRLNFVGKEYEKDYEFDIKVKSTQENIFDLNDLL